MAFLTTADYNTLIKDVTLAQVTGGSTAVQLQSELAAQQEMESYLNQRFSVGQIFGATGEARNSLIVMYMLDIALYHMHSRITPRNIPEIRADRYDAAIAWLKMVSRGDITPELPRKADDEGEKTVRSRFDSNPKISHQW